MTEVPVCQCPQPTDFCDVFQRRMKGRLWELCSGNCPASRPCSAELSQSYREKWAREAADVKDLIQSDFKVFLADLKAIGGTDACTSREVAKLGITGDPGIALSELHRSHPEVAVRAAKWILAGRPMPGTHVPTVTSRRQRLAEEVDAWIAAGRPLCADAELDARLAACGTCLAFKDGRCLDCGGCGLRRAPLLARAFTVATGRGDIPGKAEMRTAKCPRERWPVLQQPPPATTP
jgi:hypothetical protein